jgi:hypothetical protein
MKLLDAWREQIGLVYDAEKAENMKTPVRGGVLKIRADAPMKYGELPGVNKKISRLVMGVDNQRALPHTAAMFDDFFERGGNCFDRRASALQELACGLEPHLVQHVLECSALRTQAPAQRAAMQGERLRQLVPGALPFEQEQAQVAMQLRDQVPAAVRRLERGGQRAAACGVGSGDGLLLPVGGEAHRGVLAVEAQRRPEVPAIRHRVERFAAGEGHLGGRKRGPHSSRRRLQVIASAPS